MTVNVASVFHLTRASVRPLLHAPPPKVAVTHLTLCMLVSIALSFVLSLCWY